MAHAGGKDSVRDILGGSEWSLSDQPAPKPRPVQGNIPSMYKSNLGLGENASGAGDAKEISSERRQVIQKMNKSSLDFSAGSVKAQKTHDIDPQRKERLQMNYKSSVFDQNPVDNIPPERREKMVKQYKSNIFPEKEVDAKTPKKHVFQRDDPEKQKALREADTEWADHLRKDLVEKTRKSHILSGSPREPVVVEGRDALRRGYESHVFAKEGEVYTEPKKGIPQELMNEEEKLRNKMIEKAYVSRVFKGNEHPEKDIPEHRKEVQAKLQKSSVFVSTDTAREMYEKEQARIARRKDVQTKHQKSRVFDDTPINPVSEQRKDVVQKTYKSHVVLDDNPPPPGTVDDKISTARKEIMKKTYQSTVFGGGPQPKTRQQIPESELTESELVARKMVERERKSNVFNLPEETSSHKAYNTKTRKEHHNANWELGGDEPADRVNKAVYATDKWKQNPTAAMQGKELYESERGNIAARKRAAEKGRGSLVLGSDAPSQILRFKNAPPPTNPEPPSAVRDRILPTNMEEGGPPPVIPSLKNIPDRK